MNVPTRRTIVNIFAKTSMDHFIVTVEVAIGSTEMDTHAMVSNPH